MDLHIPSINTAMCGIIGNPLEHTLSPAMHTAAFNAAGVDALFVPFPILEDELEVFFQAAVSMRFIGLSVTMPYKKAVIPFMDELDLSARQCGAVNVVKISNKKLIGYNTDGLGFVQGLIEQARFIPLGKKCIILGTGGSARGIAFALAGSGVRKITILNRAPREFKAFALAADVNAFKAGVCEGGVLSDSYLDNCISEADCIINTTPVGMEHVNEQLPFNASLLLQKQLVCDIVYKPHVTPLLSVAKSMGCKTLEGYWMLVYQGVLAWKYWTDIENAPVDIMANVVKSNLEP